MFYKKIAHLLSVIVLLGVVAACSRKKEEVKTNALNMSPVTLEQFDSMVLGQRTYCSNERCPEGVGRVMAYGQGGVSLCTGTLVTHNQILTAAHCLPAELRETPELCSKRLYFQLPAIAGLPGETLPCKQVEFYGDPAKGKDYAFITLKNSSVHTPVRLVQSGLRHMQDAFVWAANMSDSNTTLIGHKRCKSIFDSLIYKNIQTTNGPRLLLGDCFIVSGNSGAPVLNNKGQMVGLITSSFSQNYINELTSSYKFIETPGNFAIVSNASCLSVPGFIESNGANCDELEREEYNSLDTMTHQLDRNRMIFEMEEALSIWKSDYGRSLSWKRKEIAVDNKHRIPFYPVPSCVIPSKLWREQLINYLGYLPKEYKQTVEVSFWSAELGLDRFGNYNFKIVTMASHLVGELVIPVKNINPLKNKITISAVPVIVSQDEKDLFANTVFSNPIFNQELPFCE